MWSWKHLLIACAALALASPAVAQKKYDTGANDTEIRIGNIMPYSGPASAYGTIGKTLGAYFNKVNAEGGIKGRKITYITYDDGYAPPKTVEQARPSRRERRRAADPQQPRDRAQHRDPEIHEFKEGAAALRRDWRDQVRRSEELPVDHGMAAELPERRPHLRSLHSEK
jgi:hypothetical protein